MQKRNVERPLPNLQILFGIIGSTLEKSPMSAKRWEAFCDNFALTQHVRTHTGEETLLNVVNVGRPSATVHPSLTIQRFTPEFRRRRKALCKFAHFRQFRWTHTGKVPFLLNITIQEVFWPEKYLTQCQKRNTNYHLFESFLWQVIWRVILEIDTGYSFTLHLRIHKISGCHAFGENVSNSSSCLLQIHLKSI